MAIFCLNSYFHTCLFLGHSKNVHRQRYILKWTFSNWQQNYWSGTAQQKDHWTSKTFSCSARTVSVVFFKCLMPRRRLGVKSNLANYLKTKLATQTDRPLPPLLKSKIPCSRLKVIGRAENVIRGQSVMFLPVCENMTQSRVQMIGVQQQTRKSSKSMR